MINEDTLKEIKTEENYPLKKITALSYMPILI